MLAKSFSSLWSLQFFLTEPPNGSPFGCRFSRNHGAEFLDSGLDEQLSGKASVSPVFGVLRRPIDACFAQNRRLAFELAFSAQAQALLSGDSDALRVSESPLYGAILTGSVILRESPSQYRRLGLAFRLRSSKARPLAPQARLRRRTRRGRPGASVRFPAPQPPQSAPRSVPHAPALPNSGQPAWRSRRSK